MKLNTQVEIPSFPFEISHVTKIIFTGSCFAENIGNKLDELKFPVLVNSMGINYNPISIGNSIKISIDNNLIDEESLFLENGLWNSFNFHSKFSDADKEKAIEKMNNSVFESHEILKVCKYLFISFGTSYIYNLKSNNEIVSNCHRLPDKTFIRKLLSVDEIVNYWSDILQKLREFNPDIQVVFTVSPIRHKRDGFVANQLSKSVLFVAINNLIEDFSNIHYFPSYEIMMDELRDYRFYNKDMIHPSKVAIDYIMERFSESYFNKETHELNNKILKIKGAINHKPFNADLSNYKKHLAKTLQEIEDLEKQYPYLKFNNEKKQLVQDK